MDVKYGSGAFMSTMSQAEEMATSIINTAAAANLKTHALITDMNECLGEKAGNALEIAESMEFLSNTRREPRLNAVVMATTAEMLVVTGIESNRDAAMQKTDEAVTSGKAAEIFEKMVRGLGGPADFVMTYAAHLPKAPVTMPVFAKQEGVLAAVDAFALGNAIIELGGGRRELNDVLDLSVGFADMAPIGAVLDGQRPLAVIHAADEVSANRASAMLQNACTVAEETPEPNPVIYKILT
jgi:thymidine phosphorylase